MEIPEERPSILSYYGLCSHSFESAIAEAHQAPEELSQQLSAADLKNARGRYRIWASNSGAHRKGRVSLDYKLRYSTHIHKKITDLLGELDKALQNVTSNLRNDLNEYYDSSEDDDDSEDSSLPDIEEEEITTTTPLQYAFEDVCHVISMLYELSATVLRRPAPRDRLQKYSAIDLSHFESFDIQHVSHKVCASQQLIERLGRANTRRRQLLRYHEQHHDKIARYIDVDLDVKEIENQEIEHELSGGKVGSTPAHFDAPTGDGSQPGRETVQTVIQSQTTVTTYKGVEDNLDTSDVISEDGQSQTSFATSLGDHPESHLFIPDPPNVANAYNDEPFQCPYCYVIIRVKGSRGWKKHVFRDLKPYVCTSVNCPNPNQLFESRLSWYEHELQFHRREWYCNECDLIFSTSSKFRDHLNQNHSDLVTDVNQDSLVKAYERGILSDQACPLCPASTVSNGNLLYSPMKLRRHLGRHLQTIALFVLPDKTQDENKDRDTEIATNANDTQPSQEINKEEISYEDSDREAEGNSELEFDSNPSYNDSSESGSTNRDRGQSVRSETDSNDKNLDNEDDAFATADDSREATELQKLFNQYKEESGLGSLKTQAQMLFLRMTDMLPKSVGRELLDRKYPDAMLAQHCDETLNIILQKIRYSNGGQEGIQYYKMAMDAYEKRGDTINKCAMMNEMGDLHHKISKSLENTTVRQLNNVKSHVANALDWHQKALNELRNSVGEAHPSTLQTLIYVGGIYETLKDEHKAVEYYSLVLNICVGTDIQHPRGFNIEDARKRLARVEYRLGNYGLACGLLQQVLAVQEEANGKGHSETINTLRHMAMCRVLDGLPKEGEECYLEILDRIERSQLLGMDTELRRYFYLTLVELGAIYSNMNSTEEHEKALNYYRRAHMFLVLLRETVSDWALNQIPEYELFSKIGLINEKLKIQKEALKYHRMAFDEQEKQLGQKNLKTLISLRSLGRVYTEMEDWKEAMNCYKLILIRGERHSSLTNTATYEVGQIYERLKDWDGAIEWYKRELSAKEAAVEDGGLREDHLMVVERSWKIAEMYEKLENWDEALKYYRLNSKPMLAKFEALMLEKWREMGSSHPFMVAAFTRLAWGYEGHGDLANALLIFVDKVLPQQENNLGENAPLTLKIIKHIATICEKLGDWEDAIRWHRDHLHRRIRINEEKEDLDILESFHDIVQLCKEHDLLRMVAEELEYVSLANCIKPETVDSQKKQKLITKSFGLIIRHLRSKRNYSLALKFSEKRLELERNEQSRTDFLRNQVQMENEQVEEDTSQSSIASENNLHIEYSQYEVQGMFGCPKCKSVIVGGICENPECDARIQEAKDTTTEEDDKLLLKLKDDERLPWKTIALRFRERNGVEYRIPPLRKWYRRLKQTSRDSSPPSNAEQGLEETVSEGMGAKQAEVMPMESDQEIPPRIGPQGLPLFTPHTLYQEGRGGGLYQEGRGDGLGKLLQRFIAYHEGDLNELQCVVAIKGYVFGNPQVPNLYFPEGWTGLDVSRAVAKNRIPTFGPSIKDLHRTYGASIDTLEDLTDEERKTLDQWLKNFMKFGEPIGWLVNEGVSWDAEKNKWVDERPNRSPPLKTLGPDLSPYFEFRNRDRVEAFADVRNVFEWLNVSESTDDQLIPHAYEIQDNPTVEPVANIALKAIAEYREIHLLKNIGKAPIEDGPTEPIEFNQLSPSEPAKPTHTGPLGLPLFTPRTLRPFDGTNKKRCLVALQHHVFNTGPRKSGVYSNYGGCDVSRAIATKHGRLQDARLRDVNEPIDRLEDLSNLQQKRLQDSFSSFRDRYRLAGWLVDEGVSWNAKQKLWVGDVHGNLTASMAMSICHDTKFSQGEDDSYVSGFGGDMLQEEEI